MILLNWPTPITTHLNQTESGSDDRLLTYGHLNFFQERRSVGRRLVGGWVVNITLMSTLGTSRARSKNRLRYSSFYCLTFCFFRQKCIVCKQLKNYVILAKCARENSHTQQCSFMCKIQTPLSSICCTLFDFLQAYVTLLAAQIVVLFAANQLYAISKKHPQHF